MILNGNISGGSSAASSSVGVVIFYSLCGVFSISCSISFRSIADLRVLLWFAEDMTYVVSSYFSTFAPYGCWKEVKATAGVLMVPDGQDSGVVDNDGFLSLKKQVRFWECTEMVEGDASKASGLVECKPREEETWLYRPTSRGTAGASDQQWLGLYLCDKDCLLCMKGCQFWWRVGVERGCTTPVEEVTP